MKSLPVFREEWKDCTRCELGVFREERRTKMVMGDGIRRAILFIAENPTSLDERDGTVLTGGDSERDPLPAKSEQILKDLIRRIPIERFYITYLVSCRSCQFVLDEKGQLMTNYKGVPRTRDLPPKPESIQTCLTRLHEEIYLVDPLVIVTLGQFVADTLIKRAFPLRSSHGIATTIQIPGKLYQPKLTNVKKQWGRKVNGVMTWPTERASVRYLAIPTFGLDVVNNELSDQTPEGSFHQFAKDLQFAKRVHDRYLDENKKDAHVKKEDPSNTPS